MDKKNGGLFEKEDLFLKSVHEFIERNHDPESWKTQLIELTRHHEKLLDEYRKIVSISDKQERSLFDTKNKLVEINHIRTHFMNLIAHDLKNPVSVIQTLLKRLNREELTAELFYKKLGIIRMALDQIIDIIEGVIRESRFKDNRFNLQPQSIMPDKPALDIISRYAYISREKKIELIFEKSGYPDTIRIDSEIVKEILDNLLSNAIKYSPRGSSVIIKAAVNPENSKVIYTVKDSGPGFSDDDKQKVFKVYGKLSAKPTNREPSSGLGLVLVNHLVELMHAQISLESSPHNGSVFTLEIPSIKE